MQSTEALRVFLDSFIDFIGILETIGKSRINFMQILDEEGVVLNYDDAELDRDLANLGSFL